MRWTIRQGGQLEWRSWGDDEYLVFDAASGDTHLVNLVTAELLRLLEASALDEQELCVMLAESIQVEDDARLRSSIADLLGYLDRVGLVEPVR